MSHKFVAFEFGSQAVGQELDLGTQPCHAKFYWNLAMSTNYIVSI